MGKTLNGAMLYMGKESSSRENGKLQRLEAGMWGGEADARIISWGMVVDEVSQGPDHGGLVNNSRCVS